MLKKNKIILGVIVLALIAGGVVYAMRRSSEKLQGQTPDPRVDQGTQPFYEQELEKAKAQVDNLPRNASAADTFRAYLLLGDQYAVLGKLQEAQEAYSKAGTAVTDNPVPFEKLYAVYVRAESYDKARENIDKALALNRFSPDDWLSKITLEKDHFAASNDDLQKLYEEALQKTNNNLTIIVSYATWYEQRGLQDAARQWWKKAAEQDPENNWYKQKALGQ